MFHADRLKIARELAGLARTELARSCGMSSSQLRALETGRKKIKENELHKIALSTGVPLEFFKATQPLRHLDTDHSHFRALKVVGQRKRLQTLRLGASLSDFHARCEDSGIVFPWDRLSDFSDEIAERFPRPEALSTQDIERLAVKLRTHFGLGLGPIPNIIQLLESCGVAVFELGKEVAQGVDAFSVLIRNERPAIFIGANPHASRRRFTVAHELGHLVLHHASSDLEPGHPTLEAQANRFAGAFLMPARSFASTARGKTTALSLSELKPMWRASIPAILIRAHQLGLLTYQQRTVGFKTTNLRWGRDNEPYEPLFERPVALKRAIEHLGLEAAGQLAAESGLSGKYLEKYLCEREVARDDDVPSTHARYSSPR